MPWSDLAAKSSNVQRFLLRVARHLRAAGERRSKRPMVGTRHIRRSEWLLAVALSLLAAGALVYGVAVGVRMPAGIAALILALLSILIASRSLGACRARLRAGGGFSRLGSAIFGAGILIAVILPGVQLVLNTRKSRPEENGFPTQDVGHDLALAFLIFTMALVAFWAGELLAEAIAMRRGREEIVPSRPIGRPWETRATYWFLVVVGVLLIIASIGSNFSQRGTVTGQGAIQLFGYSAPLAIAVGILNRHWGSRFLAAVSLGLMAFLIAEGIRTPLLIIAAAAGVRYLYSTRKRRFGLREIVVIVLAIYVGSVMLVSLSAWRGQKNTGGTLGLPEIVVLAAQDPFVHLQQQGLDTVDGLILATKVDRKLAGAKVTDPLKTVTGIHPPPDLALQAALAVGSGHAAVHQLRRERGDLLIGTRIHPDRLRHSRGGADRVPAPRLLLGAHLPPHDGALDLDCPARDTSSSASSSRAMRSMPSTCSGSASWS